MNMGAYLHVQPRLQRCMEVRRCRRRVCPCWRPCWRCSLLAVQWAAMSTGLGCVTKHCSMPRALKAAASPSDRPSLPLQALDREVPLRIKYSGRPSMASTATGFGEVHAQEQVGGAGGLFLATRRHPLWVHLRVVVPWGGTEAARQVHSSACRRAAAKAAMRLPALVPCMWLRPSCVPLF